jgi:hypothetical protein
MLRAIRRDYARPTVTARNLFHVSIAMYDAWAAYDSVARPFLLGKTVGGFHCPYVPVGPPADVRGAREEAVSYAAYRVLRHRFQYSPGAVVSFGRFDSLMALLGFDTLYTSVDYSGGSPAALGNYLGAKIIEFGLQDGANEEFNYGNLHYFPVNRPLDPMKFGDSTIVNPNRWQPITLGTFIDQNGNQLPTSTPPFLSAEWGVVTPFALTPADRAIRQRDGFDYQVYHDPGPPPLLDSVPASGISDAAYRWGHSLVAVWQSHLDPTDGVQWDISPASLGNVQQLPQTFQEMMEFYRLESGGDAGTGRAMNPRTGLPYEPQVVPRGDYCRVLAEFWADGPSSETPPGHWFSILNYVNDHPEFVKRFGGLGPVVDDLEWDVKAYFVLGGAVHDAAISAWSVKGWYDTARPISAIRYMGDHGQCTSPALQSYSPAGFDIIPGFIEVVQQGDTLAGENDRNVGKMKLYTWKGHEFIPDPAVDAAGAGWILAGKWWPYQRPTFVTPPFAGYVSGHSTFSRAAAEVMTLLTGDEYFPGGMGEFHALKDSFLVFENGPSVNVVLQWATYRDASDQCSLSRIWGGIHPPFDDYPGRLIGRDVGIAAFRRAEQYFSGLSTWVERSGEDRGSSETWALAQNYPNPFNPSTSIEFRIPRHCPVSLKVYDLAGREVSTLVDRALDAGAYSVHWDASGLASGVYLYRLNTGTYTSTRRLMVLR